MHLAKRAKLYLLAITLVSASLLLPTYTFAESGSISIESTQSLTSASADRAATASKERLVKAEARFSVAKAALSSAGSDAAARTKAQTEFIAANAELKLAQDEVARANTNASSAAITLASSTQPPAPSTSECSNLLTTFTACVSAALSPVIVYILQHTIIPLGNMALGFSGFIFDYALYFSIIKFPELIRSVGTDGANTESSIYSTWIIVRNLFNIIIVFQLLKIAIYKILAPVLNKSGGELKKLLMSIIIFTLFVNFSFFFTKALIDVSNITALQFYSGMGGSKTSDKNNDGKQEFEQGGIAMAVAAGMGIRGASIFYTSGDPGADAAKALGVVTDKGQELSAAENSIFGNLMIFVLLIIVSFVLIQGAAIFIGRSVALIFLLVFSPLMFAGGIIGFVNEWSKKWWEMLLEQLYVAPLFLGMLFLALKMAGGGEPGGLITGIKDSDLASTGGFFGALAALTVQAAIMGGLFIACAVLAKKFGGAAAQKSSTFGAKAYGATVGGVGGKALRGTVGRAANRFGNSSWLKNSAAGTGVGAAASRGLLTLADKSKNSTFDFRNSTALQGANKAAGKFGLDLKEAGPGAKLGFVKEREAKDKQTKDDLLKRQTLLNQDTYGLSGAAKATAIAENQERAERFARGQSITGKENLDDLLESETGLVGAALETVQKRNELLKEDFVRAQTKLGQAGVLMAGLTSNITGAKSSYKVAGDVFADTKKANAKARATKEKNDTLETVFENEITYVDDAGNLLLDENGSLKPTKKKRTVSLTNRTSMQNEMDSHIQSLEKSIGGGWTTRTDKVYKTDPVTRLPLIGQFEEVEVKVAAKSNLSAEQERAVQAQIQKLKSYRGAVTDKWVETQLGEKTDSGKKSDADKSDKKTEDTPKK